MARQYTESSARASRAASPEAAFTNRLWARSGERQAREHVLEQALAGREPGLRQLADDLSGGGHQLSTARGLHGATRRARRRTRSPASAPASRRRAGALRRVLAAVLRGRLPGGRAPARRLAPSLGACCRLRRPAAAPSCARPPGAGWRAGGVCAAGSTRTPPVLLPSARSAVAFGSLMATSLLNGAVGGYRQDSHRSEDSHRTADRRVSMRPGNPRSRCNVGEASAVCCRSGLF